jgi:DNA-binding NtrC family response regulator
MTQWQSEHVDLVVTDLCWPGASGIELTRELRLRDDFVPLILVTGSGSIDHAVEALKQGANDYLQQPVDPAELERIRRVASADAPVSIISESGTGRELVARAHDRRRRHRGPFIQVQDTEVSEDDDDHSMLVRVLFGTPVAEVERLLILTTLKAASGNKQRTARILGVSLRGLYTRLASYGGFTSTQDESIGRSAREHRAR